MSINKILEYQKIDMNIYKKERDFNKSDIVKKVSQYKAEAVNNNNLLNNLGAELENCYQQFSVISKKYEEIENAYNEMLKVDINEFQNLKDFEKYEKELSKLEESFSIISKELAKSQKKIIDIDNESKKLNELISKYLVACNKGKALINKEKEALIAEIKPELCKLKEMEADIDKDILEKYKALRKEKNMPAFVPYQEGNCLGCGVDIKIEVDAQLKNAFDYTECPHCGRMVYKI